VARAERARSKPRARRVLGYARVSSEEQTRGTSLEDQKASVSAYAKSLGLDVARFYVEAESGGQKMLERREQMKALMSDVREGDLVVVAKLDRWSRDVAFSYSSVDKIVAAGADFYLLAERCGPHDDTWDTIFGVHALVARLEHKRIRERTVGTRKLLRDDGCFSEGLVPIGYRRRLGKGQKGKDASGENKNALVVVEHEARAVHRVFSLCIAGRTTREIARLVTIDEPDGTKRALSVAVVKRILHRRTYTGELLDSAGDWIKGRHPAIVDVDTFARAQVALESRRDKTGPRGEGLTSKWILRDVARCGRCGAKCGSVYGRPNATGERPLVYYRCVRKCGPAINVQAIEAIAEPRIVERLEQLRDDLSRPAPASVVPISAASIATRRKQIEQKRERLIEQYTEGDIARDAYKAKLAKLDAELLRLEGEERAGRRDPLADPGARLAALRAVDTIRAAWSKAKPEDKRFIVRQLAEEARLDGRNVTFVWRSVENLEESPD
jgi:DNA invertase Pin-like site-specific DNA recombinase